MDSLRQSASLNIYIVVEGDERFSRRQRHICVTAFYGFLIANLMGGEKAFHLNLIFFFFLNCKQSQTSFPGFK